MSSFFRIVGSTTLAIGLTLFAQQPVASQPCDGEFCWDSVDGPLSGEVTAVVIDPEGLILAGTAGKGLFYKYLSEIFWTRTSSPAFDGITVRSIVIFGERLVASTSGKGVWSSLDRGVNWSALNSGLGSSIVHALMVSSDGRMYAGASDGIYRLNGDNEWINLRGGAQGHDIRAIAETSEGVLLAGSYGRGILRSTDLGISWELVGNGLATTIIRSLAVNESDEIFVGTFGGHVVQRSDDGGDTWVDSGEGLAAQGVWNVSIAPDGTYYAGARSEGIFVSTDGRNWEARTSPYTTVSGFAFSEGTVLAATKVGLLNLEGESDWSLEGIPYSRVNALHLNGDRLLAGLHLGGVHYSDDDGRSWTPSTLNNEAILAFAEDTAGNVFAGTLGSGIFRSSDRGESWEQIWKTIRVVNQIDIDRQGGILAATDNGVYRLTAGDNMWRQLTPPGLATRSAIETQEGVLIAGSERESIWRSTDGGETWSQTAPQLVGDETWIWDLVERPDGTIAAATISEGVWWSSDAGLTWEPLPGTSEEAVADVTLTRFGELVAVTFFGQVLIWYSGSAVASPLGPPFLAAPVRSLVAIDHEHMYVGTDPLGVLVLYKLIPPAVEGDTYHDRNVALEVFPNPASAETNVRLELSSARRLDWQVYDVLGRTAASGVRNSPSVGETSIQIDASRLSPGLYLISVQADERVLTGTFVVGR